MVAQENPGHYLYLLMRFFQEPVHSELRLEQPAHMLLAVKKCGWASLLIFIHGLDLQCKEFRLSLGSELQFTLSWKGLCQSAITLMLNCDMSLREW